MFNNIGDKIKTLAQVVCWIGVALSVLYGVYIISEGSGVGLLVMIFGSLLSWVGSFFTYGFGELIELTRQNQNIQIQTLNAVLNQKIIIEQKETIVSEQPKSQTVLQDIESNLPKL